MPRFPTRTACATAIALTLAQAASAQEAGAAQDAARTASGLTLGIGGGVAPDYEGSDDYRFVPGGLIQGSVGGVAFQANGTNLFFDLVKDSPRASVSITAGPIVQLRLERTGDVEDARVAALGKRKAALELGAQVGIAKRGVFAPYDSLSASVSWVRDVSGIHGSSLFSPRLSYSRPVARRAFLQLSGSAEHVGAGYARTYFDVDAVAPVAGALPVYRTLGGGFKSVSASGLLSRDFGGDPRSGWNLFAIASYKRLLGKFADSPIVAQAGSANQFFVVAGIAYAF